MLRTITATASARTGDTTRKPCYEVGSDGRREKRSLPGVLYATQFTRRLDQFGYAHFNNWRFFGEDGLAGEEVQAWLYEGTLKITYQGHGTLTVLGNLSA